MYKRILFLVLIISQNTLLADNAFEVKELLVHFSGKQYPLRHFTEVKQSEFLIAPIQSKGVIGFENETLMKKVDSPFQKKFSITGEVLTITNKVDLQTIALTKYPALLSFIEVFRSTLSGDYDGLISNYNVRVLGNLESWTLELKPKLESLKSKVIEISVKGNVDIITSFDIYESTGDHTQLTLGDAINE